MRCTELEDITNRAKAFAQFFDLLAVAAEDDNGMTLTELFDLFSSLSLSAHDMAKQIGEIANEAFAIAKSQSGNSSKATA